MTPIPEALPAGYVPYGRSAEFTPETLPDKLKSAHSTKAGTWGLLHVLEGEVLFALVPPHRGRRRARAGDTVVVESQVPHKVEFVEPGRFYIEFFRAVDGTARPSKIVPLAGRVVSR